MVSRYDLSLRKPKKNKIKSKGFNEIRMDLIKYTYEYSPVINTMKQSTENPSLVLGKIFKLKFITNLNDSGHLKPI